MTVCRATAFILIVLPFLAAASPQSTDWRHSELSPMQLAKKCDDRLHSMNKTSMSYNLEFVLPTGVGRMVGDCSIRSQSQYALEVPIIGATEREAIKRKIFIQSPGSSGAILYDPHSQNPILESKAGTRSFESAPNLLQNWYRDGPSVLIGSVGTGNRVLENLVKQAASSPKYSVQSESRVIDFNGHPVRSYRLLISKTPTEAKKSGSLRYELVIGDVFYFPLTLMNSQKIGRKTFYVRMFNTRWNPDPAQKFNPDLYLLRHYKPGKKL